MASILTVLCSGRRKGFTGGLLQQAEEGAQSVDGVEIDHVHLHDYSFGPCKSCFACIRDENHMCVQNDDLGQKGEGALFRKLLDANGIIIADPVHCWGASAMCHLFMERLYPFAWSGAIAGMPFASFASASNQGMQHVAIEATCRWAFIYGLRYVAQLPVHVAYYDEALKEARYIGAQMGHAALEDAAERKPFASDQEKFLTYMGKPWNPLENYLFNLTNGTFTAEKSIPEKALRQGVFKRPEAIELLKQCAEGLAEAMRLYALKNYEEANHHLVEASACWTHATWKEFLEEQVVGTSAPEVYRPMSEQENIE